MNSQPPNSDALPRQDLQPAALTAFSRTELEELLTGITNPTLAPVERAAIEAELERRGHPVPDARR